MIRAALLVLALGACGRLDFDPRADAAATPRCDWSNGPQLGPQRLRTELDDVLGEFDAYLRPGDPLSLTYVSDRINGFNTYGTHRPSLDAPFDPPTLIPGLDHGARAFSYNTLADGLHGYVSLDSDLHETSRATLASPVVIGRALAEINTTNDEFDPFPSRDDLTLWFASGPSNGLQIYTATRSSTDTPWGNVTPFSLDTPGYDSAPTLTADGLLIVWASNDDLFYATRASTTEEFTVKHPLVVTALKEFEPSVREDGCELLFDQGPPPPGQPDLFSIEIH